MDSSAQLVQRSNHRYCARLVFKHVGDGFDNVVCPGNISFVGLPGRPVLQPLARVVVTGSDTK